MATNSTSLPYFMKITIVDSVKGGCGKTSISLKYAIDSSLEQKTKVCVLDLDLLGSSIETFLIGEKFINKSTNSRNDDDTATDAETTSETSPIRFKIVKNAKYHLNDAFKRKIAINEAFVSRICVELTSPDSKKTHFDIIVANPDQNEKNRFKASRETHYIEQIDYGYFKATMEHILETLESLGYTDIIIDMPPNSDTYTDLLFDIVLHAEKNQINAHECCECKRECKNIKRPMKYDVSIMLVSSLDSAHFAANVEWLKTEINNSDFKNVQLTSSDIKLVFNDTINYNLIFGSPYNVEDLIKERINKMNSENPVWKFNVAYLYQYDKSASRSTTLKSGVTFDNFKFNPIQN